MDEFNNHNGNSVFPPQGDNNEKFREQFLNSQKNNGSYNKNTDPLAYDNNPQFSQQLQNSNYQQGYDNAGQYNQMYDQQNMQQNNYQQYQSYTDQLKPEQDKKTLAIVSLVLGIISLVCCMCPGVPIISSIAAVIVGAISINKKQGGKGMAIAGVILGSIGILMGIVSLVTFIMAISNGNSVISSELF